jgi:hypothetical protein
MPEEWIIVVALWLFASPLLALAMAVWAYLRERAPEAEPTHKTLLPVPTPGSRVLRSRGPACEGRPRHCRAPSSPM